ncbi:MAG: hypothetical protein EOO75_20310 [Myxococcales bacterium]|nr:MAG: hypothetical protein EOO75_20310 [Myxococcales bacterium]
MEPLDDAPLPTRRWAFDSPIAWMALLLLAIIVLASVAVIDALSPHRDAAQVARSQGEAARTAIGWRPVSPPPDGLLVEVLVATTPFTLSTASGPVAGRAPTPDHLASALAVLAAELHRYPPLFLRRAGFERVVVCEGLRQHDRPIPSLPNVDNTLLLGVSDSVGYLRRLLHHEVFHFVDYADDGQLRPDEPWNSLNPPSFRYGDGGRAMREPGAADPLDPPVPGFVSMYGTSGIEEDKAELFSFLMTDPDLVDRLARADVVLAAKRSELRARLERRGVRLF